MPITFSRRPWSASYCYSGGFLLNETYDPIGWLNDARDLDEVVAAFSDISSQSHSSLIEELHDANERIEELEKELIELETKMEAIEIERMKNE